MADASGGIEPLQTAAARGAARFAAQAKPRTVAAMADDGAEDGQLMLAYAAGDLRAFELLYARHRAALYRYLLRQARDTETANDLFQEVWSRVIDHRARYEPRAKFRTFLFTLAHNCFIDHCRRSKARPVGGSIEEAEAAELLAAPDSARPDLAAERHEWSQRFRAALATLPADQRDAFLLHEESNLSVEEIAAVMGVGAETAKSRLRYAMNKLKQLLASAESGT
jgi:RNA polymerase sigma-70 factor (ECF subfamily)